MSNPCTNFNATTNFNAMVSSMKNFKNLNISPTETEILAFNLAVGVDNNIDLFFKINPDFSQTKFTHFWSGSFDYSDTQLESTQQAIDIISELIINIGDQHKTSFTKLYSEFFNPYVNFIIDYLFCKDKISLKSDFTPNNYAQNLYLLIRGTTDDGGTRGSGTLRLCDYCQENIPTSNENAFSSFASNSNIYYKNFCGCCSILNDYYPSYYPPDKKPILPCTPICHNPEVVKAYNGDSSIVNNGYPDNKNTSLVDDQTVLRRTCIGQTICVIDKPNIIISGGNSQVEFNQNCPGCGQGNACDCYIDFSTGGNLDSMNDGTTGFQNNVIFKNNCVNSFCIYGDGNPIPCNSNNTSDTPKSNNSQYDHSGKIASNSSVSSNQKYIFGISNWLSASLLYLLLSIVIFLFLSVNITNIKREIYLLKENGTN